MAAFSRRRRQPALLAPAVCVLCCARGALRGAAAASDNSAFRFHEYLLDDPLLSHAKNFSVRWPNTGCHPEWAACDIDEGNVHPMLRKHFPHAAQNLLPCWSFFTRFPQLRPVVVLHNRIQMHAGDWPHGLLDVMGAQAVQASAWHASERCAVHGRLVSRPPPGKHGSEIRWFARSLDTALLRAKLRKRHGAQLQHFRRSGDGALHVGLLTRSGRSRSLTHAAEIAERLRTELPHANHSVALFDGWPFEKQAAWMAAQDVIITPHGAQNMNLAFVRPCTAVAEIFPRFYYVPGFYLTLPLAAGALAFAMYPGVFPLGDTRHTDVQNTYEFRVRVRNVPLATTADEVARALPPMLRARQRCLKARSANGGDDGYLPT